MRLARTAAAVLLAALVVAGCGRGAGDSEIKTTVQTTPTTGAKGTETTASQDLGFPTFATKNTTRVGGADPIADAAAVSRAVYTGPSRVPGPQAVVLAGGRDWRVGLVSAVLMGAPLRAP